MTPLKCLRCVSGLMFVAMCLYFVTIATEQSAITSQLRWGGWLLPLNGSFQPNGNTSMCNGVWDCLTQICTYQLSNKVRFVAMLDFFVDSNYNETQCGWHMKNSWQWFLQFKLNQVSMSLMCVSVIFEVANIVWSVDGNRWTFIVLVIVTHILSSLAWILYYVGLHKQALLSEDPTPFFIWGWQIATSVVLWLSCVTTKCGLVPRSERVYAIVR